MRYNCHSHIFNFGSVFTRESIHILVNRISRDNWPKPIQNLVEKILKQAIKDEYLNEEQLLIEFAQVIKADDALKQLLEGVSSESLTVSLEGDVAKIGSKALKSLLGRLRRKRATGTADARSQTVGDLIEFLRIGLKPSISAVADDLLETSGRDVAVVALTLDISQGGDADDKLYQQQLRDTARATLDHPGRILPFVCVNPARTLHYERMTHALEELGYVGVKLYPSLGYHIDTPEMRRVYEYCAAHDVPILLHCSRGGFFRDPASIEFCRPDDWQPILDRHLGLRVCFGHFGGGINLIEDAIDPDSWTGRILHLMNTFPGVYADISYHDDPMNEGGGKSNYFRHLKAILADPATANRILFGTDYHVVRKRVSDDAYWEFFADGFNQIEFKRLTESNPRAFLGLPDAAGRGAGTNIQSHLRYLAKNNYGVREDPADWAVKAIAVTLGPVEFHPNPFGNDWSVNNEAHRRTHEVFALELFSDAQKALSFTAAGKIRMRDLADWPRGLPPDLRKNALRQLASFVIGYMINTAGATREKDQTVTAIRTALMKKFDDGDTLVSAFGPVVDNSYKFLTETHT